MVKFQKNKFGIKNVINKSVKNNFFIYETYIQDIIKKKQAGEIAVLILQGNIKPTKDILRIQDSTKNSVAHYYLQFSVDSLPEFSDIYTLLTDPSILKLKNEKGETVAHYIAANKYIPKILMSAIDKEDILVIQDNNKVSVAHYLARNTNKTGWLTQNKNVLSLQDDDGVSVAHILAFENKDWYTDDPKILKLKDSFGNTVEGLLNKKFNNNPNLIKESLNNGWKWGNFLDFRFIEFPIIISQSTHKKAYYLLSSMDEQEMDEYVNDLAKYGVIIEYNLYKDEFKVYPTF